MSSTKSAEALSTTREAESLRAPNTDPKRTALAAAERSKRIFSDFERIPGLQDNPEVLLARLNRYFEERRWRINNKSVSKGHLAHISEEMPMKELERTIAAYARAFADTFDAQTKASTPDEAER